MWITTISGKFLNKWEYQSTLQPPEKPVELDMEQWTGSKLRNECVKAVYFRPAYLTCKLNTSREMLGWKKHMLESRLPGEITTAIDMQMIPPLGHKAKRN